MVVFGIYCNFFNVLPIRQKTCRSNDFFTRQNVHARKIGPISEVVLARSVSGAQFARPVLQFLQK